jgi:NAD-dependent deacetylase
MKKIVVLSGAGMSAESGISTFRDSNGLWENHPVEEVATPQAWLKNPTLVLNFYNARRKQLLEVAPNAGHFALVKLEAKYEVQIVTQNVDDLHERAGSSQVMHLHGELMKVRSENNPNLITTLDGWELKIGDLASDGAQLRPHIVWFGEEVPLIAEAYELVRKTDILIIVGTSLSVYPAASLLHYAPKHCVGYFIDPKAHEQYLTGINKIADTAAKGLPALVDELLAIN